TRCPTVGANEFESLAHPGAPVAGSVFLSRGSGKLHGVKLEPRPTFSYHLRCQRKDCLVSTG
ncbi:MAG: hypothetical protein OEQ28_16315, partial [Acidobacteriota bacterium]|nr:hypothetical protein [Acidobacteriota bacterium]